MKEEKIVKIMYVIWFYLNFEKCITKLQNNK